MLELGEAPLEPSRVGAARIDAAGASAAAIDVCDCVRECEGRTGIEDRGDVEDENKADLGLPTAPEVGEVEAFLAKGLLRTDMARWQRTA